MMTRQQILDEARSWIDVKFRHQGRDRAFGVDCGGLIIRVCHALHYYEDFDVTGYNRWPDGTSLDTMLDDHFDRAPRSKLAPGDIVLCADLKTPCHVGFVGDKGPTADDPFSIIHAWLAVRKVTENPLNIMKVLRCWRFRGVVG